MTFKTAMISQPMGDRSDEHIKKVRDKAMKELYENGYETLDTYFDYGNDEDLYNEGVRNIGVFYLAKSIEMLSHADLLYMVDDWWNAKGCLIEKTIAAKYGIPIVYQTQRPD